MLKLAWLLIVQTFSKQQTVGKMSDHELYSPDNSGSGWDNVLLAQKINKRGGGLILCKGRFFAL